MNIKASRMLLFTLLSIVLIPHNSVSKSGEAIAALGVFAGGLVCAKNILKLTKQNKPISLVMEFWMGAASFYSSYLILKKTYSEKKPACSTCSAHAVSNQSTK